MTSLGLVSRLLLSTLLVLMIDWHGMAWHDVKLWTSEQARIRTSVVYKRVAVLVSAMHTHFDLFSAACLPVRMSVVLLCLPFL